MAFQSGFRAGIDNCAPWLHVLDRSLCHVEITKDVGPESFLPLLFGKLFDSFLTLLKGCIVVQNVEFAELTNSLCDCAAVEGCVAHVASNWHASAFLCFT